jgi:hypothetical protein
MTNTNCLENIACPQCGQADSFIIEVTTRADVTDEGAETFGHMHWDERSFIECKHCETDGIVAEFTRQPPGRKMLDMNTKRALWANGALASFRAVTGQTAEEEASEAICDLICDLLHLAKSWGFNPDALVTQGMGHYEHEILFPDD